jgi:hypothetical protein
MNKETEMKALKYKKKKEEEEADEQGDRDEGIKIQKEEGRSRWTKRQMEEDS